ncbi:MAG: hypothetical protein ACLPX5_13180 [Dissulfurispiraceae bacterium]
MSVRHAPGFAKDFAYVLGKPFRDHLIKIFLTNFDAERKIIHKELVEFNKSHTAFLKRIRNFVIGHRDLNAKTQIEIIESLKDKQIYRLGTQFLTWLGKLINLLLTPIMKELLVRLTTSSQMTSKKIN